MIILAVKVKWWDWKKIEKIDKKRLRRKIERIEKTRLNRLRRQDW